MPVKPGNLILSLLSGLMLSAAWYWHLSVLIFFALVPLLVVEDRLSAVLHQSKNRLKLLGFAYITFFTWNILVTWWVVYASFGGACMAFIFNALFMSIIFVVYSNLKNRIKKSWSHWILLPLWIAWEHWHTIWDLSWTWLTIGNVFAFNHNWVQWYEITGTSGGTLWALSVNMLVFLAIKKNRKLRFTSAPVVKIAAAILLPLFISYFIIFLHLFDGREKKNANPVVVVQPNIDPYNVKFYLDYRTQFERVLKQIKGKIGPATEYLVLPETFITEDLNEEFMNESEPVQWFRDSLINKYPNLKIVTGGNTYVFYHDEKTATATSRKDEQSGKYYDVYNTALLIDHKSTRAYHKSKLVPGVERMPFPALLRPLESLAINMGGTMGSLGTQEEREVFTDPVKNLGVAPVICYESVYADFVTEYVRKGATYIFIITNDGWWDDTPGYIQHLNYARLRAIENRREIARCANTGISCFIDMYGNISQPTGWWQEDVISSDLVSNNHLTFFSMTGDLISYISMIAALLLIGFSLYLRAIEERKSKRAIV